MTDLRREAERAGRRQWLGFGLFAAALLLLLSSFSAGFFLYAALATGGLLALGTGFATWSRTGLEVRRHAACLEISQGEAVEVRLAVRNTRRTPAFWLFWREQVEEGLDPKGPTCGFETIRAGRESTLTYRIRGKRRGLFRLGPAVVEASDPLGLIRRFLIDRDVRFVTVYPQAVPIETGWPLGRLPVHVMPRRNSFFEDPSRFVGVRPYHPGDSLRSIHWRATARCGEIQVKVFEPAVLQGMLLAVEMGEAAFPGTEEPRMELAVTAAASLAEMVLASGQKAGLLSNGADAAERYPEDWSGGTFRRIDEVIAETGARRKIAGFRPVEVEPARGSWQRDRLLTAFARLIPAPGLSLAELLTLEIPHLPRSLVVTVVTPELGPGLMAALEGLQRSRIETAVLWIAEESADPPPVPRGIPVHRVRSAEDLLQLGAHRL
jgi:uncharacterized protein (DUF58 family)